MKRLVFDEDVVTATDSAGVLVCYQKGDKNEAHEKSKEISQALQAHLVGDVLENLKPDASISNETMAHALTISEAHFESQVSREDLDDPARFEKAVRRAIETTQTDESAPGLLISSIKEDHGRLRPLDLVASYGTNIPIRFFNFDPHSREKMRSSFALYREENREKAEYLIDVLFLDFIAQEMRLLPINDIIVVDVHFGTLNSAN